MSLGESLDRRVASWLEATPEGPALAALVVGVLAADVLLPVPSSVVSTFAGQQWGVLVGTAVSWLGMTLGAVAAFALARRWGRALAERLAGKEEFDQMARTAERIGPRVLVLTRALPILAEAAVLLFGCTRLSWPRFLWPVALSNLGVALAYAVFGSFSRTHGAEAWAIAASIAIPLAAATMVRKRFLALDAEPPAARDA